MTCDERMSADCPGRCGWVFLTDRHRFALFARPPHADGPRSKASLEAREGVDSRGGEIIPERRDYGGGWDRSKALP